MNYSKIKFLDHKGAKGTTKFGGQPDWLKNPEWPVSKATDKPMQFICQINLEEAGYRNIEAKFAYLFMTEDEDEYVDGTWEPDGGENAIILQPGHNQQKTIGLANGPFLYKMVKKESAFRLVKEPFECAVELIASSTENETKTEDVEIVNKIGGSPYFIQGEEYPTSEKDNWFLLLQLDSVNVPFYVNFGDAGVGYAFLNKEGNKAKFLWQCL